MVHKIRENDTNRNLCICESRYKNLYLYLVCDEKFQYALNCHLIYDSWSRQLEPSSENESRKRCPIAPISVFIIASQSWQPMMKLMTKSRSQNHHEPSSLDAVVRILLQRYDVIHFPGCVNREERGEGNPIRSHDPEANGTWKQRWRDG